MRVMIGGDIVPTESNKSLFQREDFIELFGLNFRKKWLSADVRLFNLECPLGDKNKLKEIKKSGPNLIADEECVRGIKSLNPSVICLANNHILDYGIDGANNTMRLLKNHGLRTTGLIESIESESKIFFQEKDGIRVGIYNICETEFCNASRKSMGAEPYRENKTCQIIAKAKGKCDFLIVIYHGGKEFYRYPSPKLQDRCRVFVDFGADFVACQHSHCIGCEEKYNDGTILYGQGNFIFDSGDTEYWENGLLLELDIDKDKYSVDYTLLERGAVPQISKDESIMRAFDKRSSKMNNRDFLEREYRRFARESLGSYLDKLIPRTFCERLYRRVFGTTPKRKISEEYYLALLNDIRCEAHSELITCGLEEIIKGNERGEK